MSARYIAVLAACAGGFVLATLLLLEGWHESPSRYTVAAVGIATISWVTLLSVWVLGRVRAMVHAYQVGYRHGRRDANYRLLEDGFWLSAQAEADALEALAAEENGGDEDTAV